ncbi:MAG: DmsC/YnfH family molybdoenzyme membrane anchor subunit [Slackia piriformis]
MIMHILPLLVFTTFSGLAAGVAVFRAIVPTKSTDGKLAWMMPAISIILLAVGLLGTLAHLGQPLRFINGLSNPGSMIAQEAYWSIGFGILLAIDFVLAKFKNASNKVVAGLAAIAAIGLMIVTSLAYFKSIGMPTWNTAAAIPFFAVGDLAAGAGLAMLLMQLFGDRNDSLEAAHKVSIGIQVAWLAAIAGIITHFALIGADTVGILIAGIALGPIACAAVSFAALKGVLKPQPAVIALAAFGFVALVIVRYAFFIVGA